VTRHGKVIDPSKAVHDLVSLTGSKYGKIGRVIVLDNVVMGASMRIQKENKRSQGQPRIDILRDNNSGKVGRTFRVSKVEAVGLSVGERDSRVIQQLDSVRPGVLDNCCHYEIIDVVHLWGHDNGQAQARSGRDTNSGSKGK
jgi:hypothetical protein